MSAQPRRRRHPRRRVSQPGLMIDDDGTTLGACTMLDVSLGGARLRMDSGLVAAPEFTLLLSSFGASVRRRCAVVWQADQDIGIRFLPS